MNDDLKEYNFKILRQNNKNKTLPSKHLIEIKYLRYHQIN